ncbi:MAG: ComEC/Rec2 family competence protein, partial [Planctomycetaceae bacterium]|nr:ComEC/Rec2 family competence protein [Planctomycetaceae bacterium]
MKYTNGSFFWNDVETVNNDDNNDADKSSLNHTPVFYQPFSQILISSITGILLDKFLSIPFLVWLCLIFVAVSLWLFVHWKGRRICATIFVLITCLAFFGMRHHCFWNQYTTNDLSFYAAKEGKPVAVQGTVLELPRLLPPVPDNFISTDERTIFTINVQKLRDTDRWLNVTGKVYVSVNGNRTDLMVCDKVLIFGELAKPGNAQNPDDINFAESLRRQRILCTIRGNAPESVSIIAHGNFSIAKIIGQIRHHAKKNIENCMQHESATLAVAMLLGFRDGVEEETQQNLIETGTMHILAISGLHVAVIAMSLRFLFLFCGLSGRVTAILTIVFIAQYLLLTNMAPPAIRAAVLVSVVSIAAFTGRRAYSVNSFCATALFVLLLNPTELFQFGAQLSFIATAAFFWIPNVNVLIELIRRSILRNNNTSTSHNNNANDLSAAALIEQVNLDNSILYNFSAKFFYGVLELFIISVIIWSISSMLILDRMHVFSPIAVLANPLIWLPLYAAMLSGLVAMIFGSMPIICGYIGMIADVSFDSLFGLIAFADSLGGHYWMPSMPVWWNVVFYASFIFVTIMPLRKPTKLMMIGFVLIWFLIGVGSFIFADVVRYRSDRLTMEVLAVGHGNCVLITTPDKKLIVYDVGCISSAQRAADILSRRVWRLGKTKIDVILISHPDADHFNGLEKIIERFDVG